MDNSSLLEIIKKLQEGGTAKEEASRELYLYLKAEGCEKVIYNCIKSGIGNPEDAKDLFHEAFMVLIDKLKKGEHKDNFNISNYLIGIAKYIWLNEIQKKQRVLHTPDYSDFDQVSEVNCEREYIEKEKRVLIQNLLSGLGDQCRKILSLWMSSFSMKEIAKRVPLSSERMAIKYKYRCHKKLLLHLKNRPELVQMLIN
nr:sigma-70 family RNA polymerase sigma factor [Saprospiraceae bacterium]